MDRETERLDADAGRATWKDLADVIDTRPGQSRPTVCIVSNEVVGPFKNGGIGTAMTGLAEFLASAGLKVTILYTGSLWAPDVPLARWKKRYARLGIELVGIDLYEMKLLAGPVRDRGFGASYLVYRFLSTREFDVIHFNDCGGEGGLCLAAKKLGLAFQQTLLVLAMHSPSQWILESNNELPTSQLFAAYNYAERLSVRCADVVWSPSRYLLDWAREQGFELPRQTFVQKYSMPSPNPGHGALGAGEPAQPGRTPRPEEIVFFGRLEERKGLRVFCNAVHLLRDELAASGVKVTFLGKAETCGGMNSLDYIRLRSKSWGFPVETISDLGRSEALAFLSDGDKLAVMPSPVDNSPCTVYEAIDSGLPFLAAKTGGIPELVHEDDRDKVLFEYTAESLRDALSTALESGGWIARPSSSREQTQADWLAFHVNWSTFLPDNLPLPDVSDRVAAIVDHGPGANIEATLESLAECSSIDRIIVLNRSGTKLSSIECNVYVRDFDLLVEDPTAINEELGELEDRAVLMIHSGVAVVPARFEDLKSRLYVDGLLPAARLSDCDPPKAVPPLGGSAAFSFFEGVTFTGAMLVRGEHLRTASAERALPVESPFMGLTDFCIASEGEIWPCAEVILEWPRRLRFEVKGPMPSRAAAFDECSDVERYYMLAAAYGAVNQEPQMGRSRELALAMVDRGLGPLVRIGAWIVRRFSRMRSVLRSEVLGRLVGIRR